MKELQAMTFSDVKTVLKTERRVHISLYLLAFNSLMTLASVKGTTNPWLLVYFGTGVGASFAGTLYEIDKAISKRYRKIVDDVAAELMEKYNTDEQNLGDPATPHYGD